METIKKKSKEIKDHQQKSSSPKELSNQEKELLNLIAEIVASIIIKETEKQSNKT